MHVIMDYDFGSQIYPPVFPSKVMVASGYTLSCPNESMYNAPPS